MAPNSKPKQKLSDMQTISFSEPLSGFGIGRLSAGWWLEFYDGEAGILYLLAGVAGASAWMLG